MFLKLLLLTACVIGYFMLANTLERLIEELGYKKKSDANRIKYIVRTMKLGLFVGFLLLTPLIMGIGFGEISIFLSSIFAVIGVALFAQWSILSNITASLVIFFGFPYRVGDYIKVVDKDDDISGTIEEIGLFHVIIRRKNNKEYISYPNSLILQKAVIKQNNGAEHNEIATATTDPKTATQEPS